MKIIVGLGNPGEKYKNTRHNIGFEAISCFRKKQENFSDWKLNKKFNSKISEGKIKNEKIILAKPQTFMNNSGEAVIKITKYYKVSPEKLLVIYDDIDLPIGKIRIRKNGSSGGHLGLQSIINFLSSKNFTRLKIGVAQKTVNNKKRDASKIVLKKITKKEGADLSQAIKKVVEATTNILEKGSDETMNLFN